MFRAGLIFIFTLLTVSAHGMSKPLPQEAPGRDTFMEHHPRDERGHLVHRPGITDHTGDKFHCNLGMTTQRRGLFNSREQARDIASTVEGRVKASGCYSQDPIIQKVMSRIHNIEKTTDVDCGVAVRTATGGLLTPRATGMGHAVQYTSTLPKYGFGNYIGQYNEFNAPDGAILVYKGVCPGTKNNQYGHVEIKANGKYVSWYSSSAPISQKSKCRKLTGVMMKKRIFEEQCKGG